MHEEHSVHEGYPLHEETLSQGGPPAWFLDYFGKINETIEWMEKCQEEHGKELEQILQSQEKQEKYIDSLRDFYENLYE